MYSVEPYDNPKRFLVIKNERDAYLVELDLFRPGHHACGCRWFECHQWKKDSDIPHCKHIQMVLDFIQAKSPH